MLHLSPPVSASMARRHHGFVINASAPHLLALAAAALLFISFAQCWWNPLEDPDLFWQLWAGQRLLNGQVPRTNGFSWTSPHTPWVHHEPLVGLAYAAAGLEWAGLLRGGVVSATALLLVTLAYRRDHAWATLFALSWTVVLVIYGRSERALSWGNLVLAALAFVLYRTDPRRWWRLPVAALLVGLWANVHGSFIIGILMIGLTRWYWAPIAAGLCLCNPQGAELYALLVGYGVGSGAKAFVHAQIAEWYPVDLGSGLGWLRIACLLTAGALLIRDRRWREVALWACVGALAVRHQRFFDVLGIALLPATTDALARRLPPRLLAHPAPWLAAGLGVVAVLSPRPRVDAATYPGSLLAHIPVGARLWNDFHLGGWLGYHGRPCFWDSRNDCYPTAVLEDGLAIARHHPERFAVLERWRIDSVLTSGAPLSEELEGAGWRCVAREGAFVLLQRPAAQESVRAPASTR